MLGKSILCVFVCAWLSLCICVRFFVCIFLHVLLYVCVCVRESALLRTLRACVSVCMYVCEIVCVCICSGVDVCMCVCVCKSIIRPLITICLIIPIPRSFTMLYKNAYKWQTLRDTSQLPFRLSALAIWASLNKRWPRLWQRQWKTVPRRCKQRWRLTLSYILLKMTHSW